MARQRCNMRFTGLLSAQVLLSMTAVVHAAIAQAQDTGGYQLPPSSTATPRAQGPVDSSAPPPRVVSTTPAPAPDAAVVIPTPAPTVSAAPRPTPSASPVVRPSASAAPSRRSQTSSAPARQDPPAGVNPAPAPTAPTRNATLPAAAPSSAPAPDLPTFAPDLAAAGNPSAPSDAEESVDTSSLLWALVGILLVGTIGSGLLLLYRRRREAEPQAAFVPPVIGERDKRPHPAAAPKPEVAPAPGERETAPQRPTIRLELASAKLSASLVNATLSYRIVVDTLAELSDVSLHGEMTSAHASRAAAEQFSSSETPLLHRLEGLPAGQEHVFAGDIRLPLAAITPIRHGTASLFVPLVRFELRAICNGAPVRVRSAFVVGLEDGARDARLQPFRLDHGPRVYSHVATRPLTLPEFA